MEEEKKVAETNPNPETGKDDVSDSDLEEGKNQSAEENPEAGANNPPDGQSGDGKGKTTPKQDRDTDSKNAERRRMEKAKAEEERVALEKQIREQAEFDVKKGLVTPDELKDLGLEKVEDPNQLYLAESYRKAKADGKENPVAEAYKSLFAKQSKERAAESAEAQAKAKADEETRAVVAKEQGEIKAKYGKTTGEILRAEPEFKEFFDKYGKAGSFGTCYETFHSLKGDSEKMAKKAGIPPTSGTGKGGEGNSTETDEQFLARTKAKYGNGF